jgi:hypothetical protein
MSRMSSSRVYRAELAAYARLAMDRRAHDAAVVDANRRRCLSCESEDCTGHVGHYGVRVWWAPDLQAFISRPDVLTCAEPSL